MMTITKEDVLNKLSSVNDPELKRDLVSLNMIRDIAIEGDVVSFSLVLTTPACPLKAQMERETRAAVMTIDGVKRVDINVTADVTKDRRIQEKINLPIRNVIAVGSGKGGVGKSTVAVNLAISLARKGAKVGLLDADIYGPNIPTMLGVTDKPVAIEGKRIQPPSAYGIKVMSIGFMVQPGQPLIWRGPMLHSAIQQFLQDVDWGELDYLVVDLPPGTGDVQLSLAQTIPLSGGVLVTTPQQVSFDDAYRAYSMFAKLEIPILGVVENMSYLVMPDQSKMAIFGEGGGEKLAEIANIPFLGQIPLDTAIRIGGDTGKPVATMADDLEISKVFETIAEKVAAQLSIRAMEDK